MKRLPNKPSELLKLALSDMELVEQDPRYKIDMGFWHMPIKNKCVVCLAGSVMAKTLKIPPKKEKEPYDMLEIREKLLMIDRLRKGYFPTLLNTNLPDFYDDSELEIMSNEPRQRKKWKEHMCTIIGILEAEGL